VLYNSVSGVKIKTVLKLGVGRRVGEEFMVIGGGNLPVWIPTRRLRLFPD